MDRCALVWTVAHWCAVRPSVVSAKSQRLAWVVQGHQSQSLSASNRCTWGRSSPVRLASRWPTSVTVSDVNTCSSAQKPRQTCHVMERGQGIPRADSTHMKRRSHTSDQ